MTTQAKLTDTQTTILKAAANRQDGNIEPFPPTLRGGARAKKSSRGCSPEGSSRNLKAVTC